MIIPEKLFGIVGYPLGHTMSPGLHNWAFEETGFPGVYMAWQESVEKLGDFFAAVRSLGIAGGNITIPHKVDAMRHMDEVDSRAKSIGAINTFYWKDGKLRGENTDVTGFMAPLEGRKFKSALLLGAGGAARAVLAGLKEMAVPEIIVTNRGPGKAEALACEFGAQSIPWEKRGEPEADLIVNATSLGMQGRQAENTPYEAAWLKGRRGLAYDIVYNPLETRLIREAGAAGWDVQNGLAMFVEQARAAFELWTGREMPREKAMSRAAELLGL